MDFTSEMLARQRERTLRHDAARGSSYRPEPLRRRTARRLHALADRLDRPDRLG